MTPALPFLDRRYRALHQCEQIKSQVGLTGHIVEVFSVIIVQFCLFSFIYGITGMTMHRDKQHGIE